MQELKDIVKNKEQLVCIYTVKHTCVNKENCKYRLSFNLAS